MRKISIVTICYNAAKDLEKTLSSVVSQTYSNIEYIIVDGGSYDDTLNIIEKNKSKITKWISEPDNGIYNAMNKGINMATGDWICFMNAGDTFVDDKTINCVFEEDIPENVGVIYGYTKTRRGRFRLNPFVERHPPYFQMGFCHQSSFVRTDIAKSLKFDEEYSVIADFNMMYQIHLKGYKFLNSGIDIAFFDLCGVSSNKKIEIIEEIGKMQDISNTITYKYEYYKVKLKTILLNILKYCNIYK